MPPFERLAGVCGAEIERHPVDIRGVQRVAPVGRLDAEVEVLRGIAGYVELDRRDNVEANPVVWLYGIGTVFLVTETTQGGAGVGPQSASVVADAADAKTTTATAAASRASKTRIRRQLSRPPRTA
jgi:hypothetical protein